MVSIDTGFIAILVTVLCCHGIEVDQEKREERKQKAAAVKEEAKLQKLRKLQRKREAKAQRQEEIELTEYRRRPATPADWEPRAWAVHESETPRRYSAPAERRYSGPIQAYLDRYPQYDTYRAERE